ncbi:MAG: peptide ABC transporter substrate-binding protein [Verrucomicrobiota bacterium]|jgi:oligopeptide transport system substrate-binding protein
MKRRLLVPVVGVLFGVLSCSPRHERADLVFINGAEPETLDPALITGQPEGRVVNALFEGLLRFDRHGRSTPGAAASWEVSPDHLTYTFHLRTDAKWSDGQPVTARDFVESWRRTLDPVTASAYSYQLFAVKGAEAFATGKEKDFAKVGVEATDPLTLKVTLARPTPYFLDLCAFPTLYPVRVDLIARYGDDWVKPGRLVGNGGFVLEDWRINDSIRLKKNPLYWDAGHVQLGSVDVLPISKANVAYNFYAAGQADLIMDKGLAPPSLLDALKSRPDFHAAPFLGTFFLRFNCAKGPFTDPRVRKAFSMAIDRKRITDKITRAGESTALSFVPPGIPGYSAPSGLTEGSTAAAQLLAEAGYPGGKGFPLTTYLYSEGELNEGVAIELQSMWKEALGVSIQLARQEWKVYLNSLGSLDFGIARSSWVGDYPDPNTFLDLFLSESGNNRTGWKSTHYDDLIHQAAAETDPKVRFSTLKKAEEYLIREGVPIAPLFFYVGIQLYDPMRIGGIESNVLDEHPLREIFRKNVQMPNINLTSKSSTP